MTGGLPARLLCATAFAVACLVLPAAAQAHATLESVTPARGVVLSREPAQVVFRFDEPVTGGAGAVRVFDRGGGEVQQGAPTHPGGAATIGARMRSGLPNGTYTATYRVVSADGHLVSGGSTFSVGTASAAGATVGQLLDRQGRGGVTSAALEVARGVQYLAIAIGVGALLFLLLSWLPGARASGLGSALIAQAESGFLPRWRRLLLGAAVAGALSAWAVIALEAAAVAGEPPWTAIADGALSDVLATRFGVVWALGATAWLAFGAAAAVAGNGPPRRAGRALLLSASAFLVLVPGLGGHAASISPEWLLVPANALHVAAVCVWVGGIACLLFALRGATSRLEPPLRTGLLAGVVGRFSATALLAVVAIALSGVLQAIVLVGDVGALFSTAYGRLVVVKAVLLLGLVALGAQQRRRTMPALGAAAASGDAPAAAGRRLRSLLRVEAALLLAVFVATAVLSGTPPSTASTAGPVNREARLGTARLQATIDPARVGANEFHIYLHDPRTGAPWDRAEEVTVSEREPDRGIGPLHQPALRAGPGHYVVQGAVLGTPGDWLVDVTARVSDFDEYTTTLRVPVR